MEHYGTHGWVLSEPLIKEHEFPGFMKTLMLPYENRENADLLRWQETGGNGSRTWAPITGNDPFNDFLDEKIRTGSNGVIPIHFSREKTAFLMGGNDIQAPHFDGRGKGNGVSVVFATQDDTYMCVYNESSIKPVDPDDFSKGFSIEYIKVHVPKGCAFYFNALKCLHGGYMYEDYSTNYSVNLKKGRHVRLFSRYLEKESMTDPKNDFHLLALDKGFKLTEYILVEEFECKSG